MKRLGKELTKNIFCLQSAELEQAVHVLKVRYFGKVTPKSMLMT